MPSISIHTIAHDYYKSIARDPRMHLCQFIDRETDSEREVDLPKVHWKIMPWSVSMACEWRARAGTIRTGTAQAPPAPHLRSDGDAVGNLTLNMREE